MARILVVGAYGLIGSAVTSGLIKAGHNVTGLGRSVDQACRRMPQARWIEGDLSKDHDPGVWQKRLEGFDALVHAAGVLQDGAGDDVRAIQVTGTNALYDACELAGLRRIVHISAIGAELNADTAFMSTKAEADLALQKRDLDWVILRPALVVARQAYGGTALLRGLAAFPFCVPIASGGGEMQVVAADDVVESVKRLIEPGAVSRQVFDVAHPEIHTVGDLAQSFRQWLGFASAPVLRIPSALTNPLYLLGDGLGRLGWRNPLRSTTRRQFEAGVVGNPAPWQATLGIRPASLHEMLGDNPAGLQDIWHARMFLLKPVIFTALSLFWLATGVISLGPGYQTGLQLFQSAGIQDFAPALTVGGALLDIVLGLLLIFRRTAAIALGLMAITSILYLMLGSILMPQLWADPLGPLVKVIPALTLTAVAAALLPSR